MAGGTPTEIVFWEKVAADFKRETGRTVTLLRSTTATEQRKQQIIAAFRGRRPDPDVVLMDIAWVSQLAASQWLEDLGTRGIDTSAFFANIVRSVDIHQGALIGLPLFVDAGMLYYRTDLLHKYGYAGPPKTWQELIDMSVDIQGKERPSNPDFWGFVWQGAQYEGLVCFALECFRSCGGGLFGLQKQPILDAAANVRALEMMRDFIHRQRISPPNTSTDMREEEVRLLFQSGRALFERNWPYAAVLHDEVGSPVRGRYGIAVLPHGEGGPSVAALGGWHAGVSRYSDDKDGATAFLTYLTSFKVQKAMVRELGLFPGRTDVYDDAALAGGRMAVLRQVFGTAVARPAVPFYSEVSVTLQARLNAVLSGMSDPRPALLGAQDDAEKIFASHR